MLPEHLCNSQFSPLVYDGNNGSCGCDTMNKVRIDDGSNDCKDNDGGGGSRCVKNLRQSSLIFLGNRPPRLPLGAPPISEELLQTPFRIIESIIVILVPLSQ